MREARAEMPVVRGGHPSRQRLVVPGGPGWVEGQQISSRVNVPGVGISAINMTRALSAIERWIENGERRYICVTGVHGVMESQRDEDLRRIHNSAGLVTPDGMPLVWIGRLKAGPQVDRVYGPDLMLALCQDSVSKRYRHYLYGGAEGVPERLASYLQNRFPGLQIVGTCFPPFRELAFEEDEEIVRHINETDPDLVWVRLSTPKQERWMATHVGCLTAPVIIGVGAAFDFHAGLKKQAPGWMQGNGLEWLHSAGTG